MYTYLLEFGHVFVFKELGFMQWKVMDDKELGLMEWKLMDDK